MRCARAGPKSKRIVVIHFINECSTGLGVLAVYRVDRPPALPVLPQCVGTLLSGRSVRSHSCPIVAAISSLELASQLDCTVLLAHGPPIREHFTFASNQSYTVRYSVLCFASMSSLSLRAWRVDICLGTVCTEWQAQGMAAVERAVNGPSRSWNRWFSVSGPRPHVLEE